MTPAHATGWHPDHRAAQHLQGPLGQRRRVPAGGHADVPLQLPQHSAPVLAPVCRTTGGAGAQAQDGTGAQGEGAGGGESVSTHLWQIGSRALWYL